MSPSARPGARSVHTVQPKEVTWGEPSEYGRSSQSRDTVLRGDPHLLVQERLNRVNFLLGPTSRAGRAPREIEIAQRSEPGQRWRDYRRCNALGQQTAMDIGDSKYHG